ncbi:MAG: OmpA family protein [Bacteroidetes bacterium]|nr:OmpA family protein [Bacteroidota bacterium]
MEDIERGAIVRDTFHVTSFKHIRENFRLRNSTFIYGTAAFDNPKGTYPELTRLAKIATRMGAELELHGHTDESGDPTSNKVLSLERAASVKAFLVDKCGFDPAKIDIFGYGADRPLCEEDTEACRRRNRRIEVKFKMPELPQK